MPTLNHKKDGSWYIRAYEGEDKETGREFYSTWQVHAAGEDVLRQHRIWSDGDTVSTSLLQQLQKDRLVWNDGGTQSAAERRKKVAREPVPNHEGRELYAPRPQAPVDRVPRGPAYPGPVKDLIRDIPMDVILEVGSTAWQLYLVLDRRRHPDYDARWIDRIPGQDLRLHAGDMLSADLSGHSPQAKLNSVKMKVAPFYIDLDLYLGRLETLGHKKYPVGTVARVRRDGTLFDSAGQRIWTGEQLCPKTWYYSLIQNVNAPPDSGRPPVRSCKLRTLPSQFGWRVVGFRFTTPTDAVKEYLRQLGCVLR